MDSQIAPWLHAVAASGLRNRIDTHSFFAAAAKCSLGSFSGRVKRIPLVIFSPSLFSIHKNRLFSHSKRFRPLWTSSANGRLEQTRMDRPIATRNRPVGTGMKNERINRTPMAFQKKRGSFIFNPSKSELYWSARKTASYPIALIDESINQPRLLRRPHS